MIKFSWNPHQIYVKSLYRTILRNERNWCLNTSQWRRKAVVVRSRFDENKNVFDPILKQKHIDAAEFFIEKYKHPLPYIAPTAAEGSKWERNIPPPEWICEMTPQEEEWTRAYEAMENKQ
eukprot:Sdes_comp9691_c0_seq1m1190